jgi:hypothetical protein
MADDATATPDPTAIPASVAAVPPAGDPTGIPATLAAPAAGSDMPTPMGTTPGTPVPAATGDPEVDAGSVHQNWLSRILDSVGTILGGDKTIVATKHPDGTVSVEHNPSTTGEKWGRVAQAALGGAARGMAVGQGPGGAGRAFAAGAQAGLAQPQQNLAAANAEAANMNAQQLATAQRALLNQQITINGWNIAHLSRDDQQNQANISLAHAKTLQDLGAIPVAMNVKSGTELAGYGKADPLSVGAHVGVNGDMIYNEGDGQGGVNFYRIPADVAKQRTKTDDHWTEIKVDPDHPTQTLSIEHLTEAGQDLVGARLTKHMAQNVANDAAIKQAQQAKVAQQEADTKALEAQGKPALTAAETTRANAQAAEASANAVKARATLPGLPGGTPQPIDDPNNPPVPNFDPGTPGINPKKIGVIPADAAKAARLARNIQHNGQIINDIVTRRPDLVGTINSLGTNWQQKVTGTNDADLAALNGAVDQLAIASAGAHGSRAAGIVEGIHDGVINHFKNGPSAVKAYTQGQMNSVQTFINEEDKYRHYGDPVGPSTAAIARAIARAPGAAPAATTPAATGTPATGNTSQAARAPGAGGYQQGVNTPQFPIAQSADGKTRTQWNGTTWATLP